MKTTNQIQKVEEAILTFKNKLAHLPRKKNGSLKRVSAELQREGANLLGVSGLTCTRLAKAVGVDGKSIRNWRDAHKLQPNKAPRRTAFKRLKIMQVPEARSGSRTFAIELIGGARVTGLSIEELAKLMSCTGGAR